MITLLITTHVHDRFIGDYVDLARQICARTQKEEGCIRYDYSQDLEDPAAFVLVENWASQEDLDRHLKLLENDPQLAKMREMRIDSRMERFEV